MKPLKCTTNLILAIFIFLFVSPSFAAAQRCFEYFKIQPHNIEQEADSVRLGLLKVVAKSLENEYSDYARRRYGSRGGIEALELLENINPSFVQLIVDPGLILRIENFVNFIEKENLQNEDPWLAREKFSKFLGKKIVYRALVLTPIEHAKILTNGIDSALLRTNSKEADYNRAISDHLVSQVRSRVNPAGNNMYDPLLSISGEPNIASSAASAARTNSMARNFQTMNPFLIFQGAMSQSLKQVYLYEIEIPEIDLLYYGLNDKILPVSYANRRMNITVMTLAGQTKTLQFSDPIVESFILFRVEPSEIKQGRALMPYELAHLPYFSNN